MGLTISRIRFKNGIPTMGNIKNQFKTQTGLNLWLSCYINLTHLPKSSKFAVKMLSSDIEKYEKFKGTEFNDWELKQKKESEINYMIMPSFYNHIFYTIDFRIDRNIIELEYPIACNYFANSLSKALHDLGGVFIDYNNEILEIKNLKKRWKKLKHWGNYKWFNRPKK